METENVAQRVVRILKSRDVEFVFGIPGEENIYLVDAISKQTAVKFILTRHEQGASFMAEVYGRLLQKPAVAIATLGPGAINLLLGTADALTTQVPLIAISAQAGTDRLYKESHQSIDLEAMFKPITKFSHTLVNPTKTDEIMLEALDRACAVPRGPVYLGIPQDIEVCKSGSFKDIAPLAKPTFAVSQSAIAQACKKIQNAKCPIVLAGMDIINGNASAELSAFIEKTHLPIATTFMAKGAISDKRPEALGVIGFMAKDYQNFAFDQADLILSLGYHFSEFDPVKINPNSDKEIICLGAQEILTDEHFRPSLHIAADLTQCLTALKDAMPQTYQAPDHPDNIRKLIAAEREFGIMQDGSPLKPQSIVMTIRENVDDDTIVLSDTGALKMWMARLYPTYKPNTLLIDNGLSTMSWTLPGSIGAKLAKPEAQVLAVMGDGSFMMNSQELETAHRYNLPINILVWVDNAYGLIKWKMDIAFGHFSNVDFTNPDFIKYAESFGACAVWANDKAALAKSIKAALADTKNIHVIFAPVDYSENMKLIEKLGATTVSL